MVFTTIVNLVRSKGPDKAWRYNKIFKLSAHFFGRRRNCYSIAIRNVHRALVYATRGRALKKRDVKELHDVRITAACSQFGISMQGFRTALARNQIMLNSKSLAELAIYEPKTFESLAMIARERCIQDGIYGVNEKEHDNRVHFYNDEQSLEKERDDGKTPSNYSAYTRYKKTRKHRQ